VADIINTAFKAIGKDINFDIETDFYALAVLADSNRIFDEWNRITDFLSS
jgi:hypothetical protein